MKKKNKLAWYDYDRIVLDIVQEIWVRDEPYCRQLLNSSINTAGAIDAITVRRGVSIHIKEFILHD